MQLPFLSRQPAKSRQQLLRFGGVHYAEGASLGELSESTGLSSREFPVLSQRLGRKTERRCEAPTGLFAKGKLCLADGENLLFGKEVVGKITPGEKRFAAINSKIVVFPDKVFYDTETKEFGSLEAEYLLYPGSVGLSESALEITGSVYTDCPSPLVSYETVPRSESLTVCASAQISPETGALSFAEPSLVTADALYPGSLLPGEGGYREVLSAEEGEEGFRLTLRAHLPRLHRYESLRNFFSENDAVELSGFTNPQNNKTLIVRAVSDTRLTFSENALSPGEETAGVTVRRRVPALTCLCESGNRLWGAQGNTVYASALGDPRNFYLYDGLSTDSYAVSVGTDGEFTGCIAYGGSVLFWKEHCVHKVLGTLPSNYELYTYYVQGVQSGSERSLAVINETLFYKGRTGVYAYSGGVPELISEGFGTRLFFDAAAGTDGENYYLSMRDASGKWGLWVFDPLRGIWLREDSTHAAAFAYLDGALYFLDAEKKAVLAAGQDDSEEGDFLWQADFAPFTEEVNEKKCYSKLYFRLESSPGAWVRILLSCDGGPFFPAWETHNSRKPTVTAYLRPNRCDSFRVRLEGKGRTKIKSFVREYELGSEA